VNELSSRVKAARELRLPKLSQRELASQAGLSTGYICQLESGTIKQPALDTLEALAGVLECTVQWLAFGVGAGPKGLPRSKPAARKKAS